MANPHHLYIYMQSQNVCMALTIICTDSLKTALERDKQFSPDDNDKRNFFPKTQICIFCSIVILGCFFLWSGDAEYKGRFTRISLTCPPRLRMSNERGTDTFVSTCCCWWQPCQHPALRQQHRYTQVRFQDCSILLHIVITFLLLPNLQWTLHGFLLSDSQKR